VVNGWVDMEVKNVVKMKRADYKKYSFVVLVLGHFDAKLCDLLHSLAPNCPRIRTIKCLCSVAFCELHHCVVGFPTSCLTCTGASAHKVLPMFSKEQTIVDILMKQLCLCVPTFPWNALPDATPVFLGFWPAQGCSEFHTPRFGLDETSGVEKA